MKKKILSGMGCVVFALLFAAQTQAVDDGSLKWSFTTNGWAHPSPAIGADGTIYLTVHGVDQRPKAQIYALNPDGTKKWSFDFPARYAPSPAIGADGTIYVGLLAGEGNEKGAIYAF